MNMRGLSVMVGALAVLVVLVLLWCLKPYVESYEMNIKNKDLESYVVVEHYVKRGDSVWSLYSDYNIGMSYKTWKEYIDALNQRNLAYIYEYETIKLYVRGDR